MFRRHKPSEISTVKSKKKFLSDKESTHKIKHLKILIDNLPNDELQAFFIENSSLIFQVFSDCFFGLEWDVRLKGSGNYVKDLELVLAVFEKILLLLPENIHKRWQYNCIIDVIEDLLYEKNTLKLRKRGIRLFLIWYQILGLNATHVCHKIFNNLIPEFGSLVTEYQKREKNSEQNKQNHTQSKIPSRDIRGQVSQESRISHVVAPRERVALLTSAVVGEDESVDDESMVLLQVLLRYLVTESIKVEWLQLRYEQHLMQSWFLFEKLKHSYLPVIFPCLSPSYSVYSPTTSSVTSSTVPLTSNILQDYPIHPSRLSYYQLEFTCWLAAFVYTGPRTSNHPASSDGGFTSTFVTHGTAIGGGGGGAGTSFHLGGFPWDTHGDANEFQLSRQFRSLLGGGSAHGEPETVSHSKVNGISRLSNSPPIPAPPSINQRDADDSVISTSFQESLSQTAPVTAAKPNTYHLGKEVPVPPSILQTSSAPQKFVFNEPVFNYSDKVVSMVHQVLYGCRQNINLIQDILHQALLLPLECHKALYYVTTVYGSWLENKYNRPIFMQPLDDSVRNWNEVQKSDDRPSSTLEEAGTQGINSQLNDTKPIEHSKVKQSTPEHVTVHNHPPLTKTKSEEDDAEELRGCLQNTIQIMLENMASVFYATSLDSNSVNKSTASSSPNDYTKHQIELCRLVLQIFQYASNSNELTAETWSKLLSILMDIMRKTMINTSPTNVQNYKWLLNNKLTQNLFQTLNGALLRASLFSPISSEPWDQCLSVYSKLTHWPSLIIEWKKVMRMLTSTMAKLVYGVDLSDLPQEKKGPRIKRLAGSNVTNRARPKSLTEAVLNYTGSTSALSPPPVPFPSALSVLSVHENLLDDNLVVVMPPNSVDSAVGVGGGIVTEPEDGDHSEIRNQSRRRRRISHSGSRSSSRRNSQEISEKLLLIVK
uniref:Ral GTPase-activating protein subunit alpha/beta N-terminal domain-containing protein n=1 Tax=Trichobilharzia regenti TaxID=157069 RepID=A0AA85K3D7_TRIRE|nr:unnamed protein product [Trichobilharzia regenti]